MILAAGSFVFECLPSRPSSRATLQTRHCKIMLHTAAIIGKRDVVFRCFGGRTPAAAAGAGAAPRRAVLEVLRQDDDRSVRHAQALHQAPGGQGLTLVHLSARRKHILWDTVGCMISPQSVRQGDMGRCDQNGLG